jgi:hypothetical protein
LISLLKKIILEVAKISLATKINFYERCKQSNANWQLR